MAKRRYGFDDEKLARFLKEERGQGHGKNYRPWLTIQDVSSLGRSSRIHSRKTGREHHLLSDIESDLFMLLDWSDSVTDIREQFPLDRDETRAIAADMGVRHPADACVLSDGLSWRTSLQPACSLSRSCWDAGSDAYVARLVW